MSTVARSATIVTPPAPSKRILSLDQFRGYTVVGMLLVNYLGFECVPHILRHSHDYNSYADTIMPQFLFAVGFSLRLSFGRHAKLEGLAAAYWRVVRRLFGLVLVAIVVYGSGPVAKNWGELTSGNLWEMVLPVWKREWWQTLMHIAATSLWLVPVIRASFGVRLAWMLASAAAHVYLSHKFNYVWVNSAPNGIDGGPLGFLTWAVPAMLGTFACDAVAGATAAGVRPPLGRMVAWSLVIMASAWVMSCGTRMYDVPQSQREAMKDQKLAEHPVFPPMDQVHAHFQKPLPELLAEPPFVHPPWNDPNSSDPELSKVQPRNGPYFRKWNYWMMSQRGGNLSYPLFAGGFSLFVYVLFYIACDMWGWRLAFFETFGTNALLAYVLHGMVASAVKPFVPGDAPGWYVTASVIVFFWINWVILRQFEKNKWYVRV